MAKGILFDFEGTVARRAEGRLRPCVQEMRNLGYEVFRPELQAAYDFVLRVEFPRKGHENVEAFVESVMRHLGHRPKRTELMALAPLFAEYHRFAPYEDAARAIHALVLSHKVGIVSALPPFLVRPTLESLKADARIVTPKEAGAAFPSPKAFRAAAQALGMRPKDVAVVSADCEDGLAVPKSLGFRTVYLRRQGSVSCAHAAIAIKSLDELETVLKPAAVKVETAAVSPAASAKA